MTRAKSFYRNGQSQLAADQTTAETIAADLHKYEQAMLKSRLDYERNRPAVPVPTTARGVRIRFLGWYQVVRVNRSTVTVVTVRNQHTGLEGHARYPLGDVVEVAS